MPPRSSPACGQMDKRKACYMRKTFLKGFPKKLVTLDGSGQEPFPF